MATGDALSVVVPSRREGPRLLEAVRAARVALGECEIVVVAHDEPTGVRDAARAEGVAWIDAPRACRGLQLALGARHARGGRLAFLHADTRLPAGAGGPIRDALSQPGVAGGAFRLRFDRAHPVLGALSWLSGMTAPASFLGDQCLFCTRAAYEAAGGFRPDPLFEDVGLAMRLARVGRLVRLRQAATTSARRFTHNGPLRQVAKNTLLMLAFHAGASPRWLGDLYESATASPRAAGRGRRHRPARQHAGGPSPRRRIRGGEK